MTVPASTTGGLVVVSNDGSGSSVDADELRAAFAATGSEPTYRPTTEDSPGTEQARRAVEDGAGTVVACGGDGTVRAVIEGVAGSACALGIVPLGTGNLLAANLGLPSGLDAVPTAIAGPTRTLDVGVVNGERFAVMAGIGLDAAVVGEANPTLKRRTGTLAYVVSAARQLPGLRRRVFRAAVRADDDQWRGTTVMVLIGNCGQVSGGLEVFPDARPDDGLLDVAVLRATGVRQWSSVLWRMLRRREQRPELVHRLRGSRVTVELDRRRAYQLDGEVRDETRRLDATVERDALHVRT